MKRRLTPAQRRAVTLLGYDYVAPECSCQWETEEIQASDPLGFPYTVRRDIIGVDRSRCWEHREFSAGKFPETLGSVTNRTARPEYVMFAPPNESEDHA